MQRMTSHDGSAFPVCSSVNLGESSALLKVYKKKQISLPFPHQPITCKMDREAASETPCCVSWWMYSTTKQRVALPTGPTILYIYISKVCPHIKMTPQKTSRLQQILKNLLNSCLPWRPLLRQAAAPPPVPRRLFRPRRRRRRCSPSGAVGGGRGGGEPFSRRGAAVKESGRRVSGPEPRRSFFRSRPKRSR